MKRKTIFTCKKEREKVQKKGTLSFTCLSEVKNKVKHVMSRMNWQTLWLHLLWDIFCE